MKTTNGTTNVPVARFKPARLEHREKEPRLVFSPLCWLKLQYFCHIGDSEIGGFGITRDDDPLYVEQFQTVLQGVSAVSVEFADSAVADYFDACVDSGIPPRRCGRTWLHTHPGDSPAPSSVDEKTFARVFGKCDFAVMFILSRTARTYARLSFSAGPGGSVLIPVLVDWEGWPQQATQIDLVEHVRQWRQEYESNVQILAPYATPALFATGGEWPGQEDELDELWCELQLMREQTDVDSLQRFAGRDGR